MDDELDEIRKRLAATTKGNWIHIVDGINSHVVAGEILICDVAQAFSDNFEDGEFIAYAKADIQKLLHIIEELKNAKG